jgi:hypothetical protein
MVLKTSTPDVLNSVTPTEVHVFDNIYALDAARVGFIMRRMVNRINVLRGFVILARVSRVRSVVTSHVLMVIVRINGSSTPATGTLKLSHC